MLRPIPGSVLSVLTVSLAVVSIGLGAFPDMTLAGTVLVRPDGTGDYPDIQAAVSGVAPGSVIELEDGTYTGAGNRAIDFEGKALTIRGQSGNPFACVIDCQGADRAFVATSGEEQTTLVEGITVTGGQASTGGVIQSENLSIPLFRRCRFIDNHADGRGGVAYASAAGVIFDDCTFEGNTASDAIIYIGAFGTGDVVRCTFVGNVTTDVNGTGVVAYAFRSVAHSVVECVFIDNVGGSTAAISNGSGGGMDVIDSVFLRNVGSDTGAIGGQADLIGCTLVGNEGASASGVRWFTQGSLERTIIADGVGGPAVICTGIDVAVDASCSNLIGNEGGDWVDCLTDFAGAAGNFSADPLFCDLAGNDVRVDPASPCLPGQHPDGADCGLVGAGGEGCAVVGVADVATVPDGFLRAWPNPSSGVVRLVTDLPAGRTEVVVHDATGREVRTFVASGVADLVWDGRDTRGAEVAPGIYFFRLTGADGERASTKVQILR